MSRIHSLWALLAAVCLLGGCALVGEEAGDALSTLVIQQAGDYSVEYKDTGAAVDSDAHPIYLQGDTIAFEGDSSLATVAGNVLTVKKGGTYVISGTLTDGQIVVEEPGEETVRLVLNGAKIRSETSAPIYMKQAKNVVLVLEENTYNTVTDNTMEDVTDGTNAAIYSRADLTVTGVGALMVRANYRNGFSCDKELKITDGAITVTAAGNGLKAGDCVAVGGGTLTVSAERDGIKASNTTDVNKGFLRVDGGRVVITAQQDGMQAASGLVIAGGMVDITSGGGSAHSSDEENWGSWGETGYTGSAKALKAEKDMVISGGVITVDASDDAIHSNGNVEISGGTLSLSSGNDGIHADNTLIVRGGDLVVHRSYEGLEALGIAICGGKLHVTAADDGLNAAGGSDHSSVGGRPGQNDFAATEGARVEITGGYLVLNAEGDGLDSNDTVTMAGGTVLIYGATETGGAINYINDFTMDGGVLIAVGQAELTETVSAGEVNALCLTCAPQAAGAPLRIEDTTGDEILTLAPPKDYSSAVIVLPDMTEGKTYTLRLGGRCDGSVTDGVVSGGVYTPGELSGQVTLSGVSTRLDLR
ncbi:MAG: carbohydrate-binding domain-containing protein [Clostridia bacterium]|nr:carbohydrate-binding domain-containing protein [Clostridia bacterium]